MQAVARSPETRTATVTSGRLVSVMGRAPRAWKMTSEMASLERRATNCVFRRLALVPCASMAKVAPEARWLVQSMRQRPS